MTTLCFNSVENDPFKVSGMSEVELRVREIIAQILNYGVDPKYLFKPEDVLQKKNTQKVIRCLEEVKKLVMKQILIFSYIEKEISNERAFFIVTDNFFLTSIP